MYKRFVIVGTYRTGSSAIVEALQLHPEIVCGWEWTLHLTRKIAVARQALSGNFSGLQARHRAQIHLTSQTSALGFKRLFRASDRWLLHPRYNLALWVDRLEGHLRWWRTDPSMHLIHVIRRDHAAWIKSKALADATGQYGGGAYPADLRLHINLREAVKRVEAKTWIDERLSTLQRSNPYCQVYFEDFAADNAAVTRRLCAFLGVDTALLPNQPLRHTRQSREGIPHIVNFDTVRDAIGQRGL